MIWVFQEIYPEIHSNYDLDSMWVWKSKILGIHPTYKSGIVLGFYPQLISHTCLVIFFITDEYHVSYMWDDNKLFYYFW